MAVTEETLRLARGMRVYIDGVVDQQTRDLVRSWSLSWDTIAAEMEASVNALAAMGDRWPSPAMIRRHRRTVAALAKAQQELEKLASQSGIRIVQDVEDVLTNTVSIQSHIIGSQLPYREGQLASLATSFDRLDERALGAIARRTTRRVTNLASLIPETVYHGMISELHRGIIIGENPRRAASRMFDRVGNRFENGLHRMNIISRTEMLDAHRVAANENMKENSDVLGGWMWLAETDERTCPSCWSQHGEIFSLDTPGPEDHQQGRCTSVPHTRSWKDLGFDIEEPESLISDAQEEFYALPEETQQSIMGKQRLDMLKSGDIGWGELSTYKTNSNWRGSYQVTPVSSLGANT